jgi:quinol monooxygenase YgiN
MKAGAMIQKDTAQLVCVAEFRALEGKEMELIAAMHSLIEPTRKEQGCLRYELNQRSDDPRRITFIEKWKNQAAFDEHCATAYIKHFFDEVRPRLVVDFEVKLYWEILA